MEDSRDSIGVPQSRWEVCYEELCRRVDHQIQENQRLENQSLFIIRIIIATIGTLITAFSVIAVLDLPVSLNSEEIFSLSGDVADFLPMMGEGQTDLISIAILLIFVWYGSKSVVKIFIETPRHAYYLLEPNILEPSIDATKMEVFYKEQMAKNSLKHTLISEYSDIVESNEDRLETTRDRWSNCISSLKTGSFSFGVSLMFIVFSLLLQEPELVGLLLITLSAYLVMNIDLDYVLEKIGPYLTYDIRIDIPLLSISFFVYANNRDEGIILDSGSIVETVSILLIFISLAALFLLPSKLSHNKNMIITLRTAGFFFMLFSLLFIVDLSISGNIFFKHRELTLIFTSLMTGSLIGVIGSGLTYLARVAYKKTQSLIEMLNNKHQIIPRL